MAENELDIQTDVENGKERINLFLATEQLEQADQSCLEDGIDRTTLIKRAIEIYLKARQRYQQTGEVVLKGTPEQLDQDLRLYFPQVRTEKTINEKPE